MPVITVYLLRKIAQESCQYLKYISIDTKNTDGHVVFGTCSKYGKCHNKCENMRANSRIELISELVDVMEFHRDINQLPNRSVL